MLITNSTPADLKTIFYLFEEAIAYQKTKFYRQWQGFDQKLIEQEIAKKRHWKIMIDDQLAAFFSVTFDDALIWGHHQKPALYIHRIVANPLFRGRRFMKQIIAWAKEYARENHKKAIRMDTWGDNEQLIRYYVDCGFNFLGLKQLDETAGLPKHYEGIYLSLFEINLAP